MRMMHSVSEQEARSVEGGNPWALGAVAVTFFGVMLYKIYKSSQDYFTRIRGNNR